MREIYTILLCLGFCLTSVALGGTQPRPGASPKAYQEQLTALKNRRDTEIAALIKQRDAQLLALQQQLKNMVQGDISQIRKDQIQIQQKIRQGQDMSAARKMLAQQEQIAVQKSNALQVQINKIKLNYDQQIEKVAQAYAQTFANLQQKMTAQGIR